MSGDCDDRLPTVRASQFFIAFSVAPCTGCTQLIPLIALGAPAGHERLDDGAWQASSEPTLLFDIDYLAPESSAQVQATFPRFRPAPAPDGRWLNHCEYCGASQADYWLHCEPGAVFLPLTAAAADGIDLIGVGTALEAAARGLSEGIPHFDAMRRVG